MTTHFRVGDMSCGHCVQAITEAVRRVDAEAQVEADLQSKLVSVRSGARDDALRTAIREAGYSPEPA